MPIIGMKFFTKEALIAPTAGIVNVPSDLLPTLDSIIKISGGVATGTKASRTISYTEPTANLTFTAVDVGTAGNSIMVTGDGSSPLSGHISVECKYLSSWVIEVLTDNTLTCAEIRDYVNAHAVAKTLVLMSTTTPTIIPIPTEGYSAYLTGGTAGSVTYYPCTESDIKGAIEDQTNPYLEASVTCPTFVRRGDTSANQILEFTPTTISSAKIYYLYQVADLSSDSSTLTIPTIFEELVIHRTMSLAYEILMKNAESNEKEVEYAQKVKEYNESYLAQRASILGEKTRLQSSDIKN
jgi:hypothetical protein